MTAGSGAPGKAPPAAREVPCLMVQKGLVLLPGPDGPERVSTATGGWLEAFDAFDRLVENYRRIYVVDLEGVQKNEPQLDLWQELSREADLWIDGGVQLGDQAIDILVSGARRAVLSTSRIRTPEELDKAWKLSQELAFEIEVSQGKVPSSPPVWHGRTPESIAEEVRAAGPTILILSFRGENVDWELVRRVAGAGPTWVAGSYLFGDLQRVRDSGARGGIFHPTSEMLLPPP
jgi:hypothetical protein